MTKEMWRARIIACMEEAGTYKPFFDDVVDTLSDILQRRDDAMETFHQMGDEVVIVHVNKAGAKNLEQHPVLRVANNLNADALNYWKELGLTPAALRKMNDAVFAKPKVSSFAKSLTAMLSEAEQA